MKATVSYDSGLMLTIPKESKAPMLLLEWVSNFRAGQNVIHKVINNQSDVIKIRLNCIKEQYLDCAEYINNNL